jgi:hypothetical protein
MLNKLVGDMKLKENTNSFIDTHKIQRAQQDRAMK